MVTCSKLGSVRAMSLNFWNATRSRASRQISNHKLLDLEVALGELQSISSKFRVRRRLYDVIISLECFSRVLVPLPSQSKRRVRRKDRVVSETELFSGVLVPFLVRSAS